jgi:hypothetical protein
MRIAGRRVTPARPDGTCTEYLFDSGVNPMLRKFLAAAALAVLMGTAPSLAQEQAPTTPAPEAAPQPAAKTATTKKTAPPARVRRVQHHWYESRDWPWNWPWPRWGYELRHPRRH